MTSTLYAVSGRSKICASGTTCGDTYQNAIDLRTSIYKLERTKLEKSSMFCQTFFKDAELSICMLDLIEPRKWIIHLSKNFLAIATAAFFFGISIGSVRADEASCGPMHEEITHDALAATFNAANLNLVERACESQCKPGSEAASEARRHFGDENFSKALAYMDRQKRLIIDFSASADTNPMDRARALYHLGLLLHTAQDFYSHTNYVELAAERMKESHSGNKDPYSMDLVDWTKLASNRTSALQSSHDLYKDDPNGAQGKIAYGNSCYYKIAKELAVKETMRQWNSVEALIKLRHAARASAILTAMKEASCPYIKDLDKFPEDEI